MGDFDFFFQLFFNHTAESNLFRELAALEEDLRIFRKSCKYVLESILCEEYEFLIFG